MSWTARLKPLSMGIVGVVLCAVLLFLNNETQDKDKAIYLENVALLQQLKQLDAEWQLLVLQAKLGSNLDYDLLARTWDEMSRRLQQLQASIVTNHDSDGELAQQVAALNKLMVEKSELIERFKSHNSILRNSQAFLPTAAADLQKSLLDMPLFEAASIKALADGVNQVLLSGMIYTQSGTEEKVGDIQRDLETLLRSRNRLSAVSADQLDIFAAHMQTLLHEQAIVSGLLAGITAVPTGVRLDMINSALSDEQQRVARRIQVYQLFLLLFSAGLITLFMYSAIRLIRSHSEIKHMNAQLRQTNDGLEQRVQERTGELVGSLAVLNATLESSPDGILGHQFEKGVTCYNSKFQKMWGVPDSLLAAGVDPKLRLELIASQLKDTKNFVVHRKEMMASGEASRLDVLELKDGRFIERNIQPQWINGENVGVVICFRDITERRRAEQQLEETHRKLLETSRQAGMAEVASNVLHNVGNVLNSVNVSANLIAENMKRSKAASLVKVSDLLQAHEQRLGEFLDNDPKGRQLPGFIAQLGQHLINEQQTTVKELDLLRNNIDHIKEIVSMQQNYSKVSGVKEVINVIDLMEDAMRMNAGALQRHGVAVVREFEVVPTINTEKHKILQILVNLVRNAKYACSESGRADKQMTLRIGQVDDCIRIAVIDNGVGISAENMTRIFGHGFTTRKEGHGFGLHSGALAARELGGALHVHSDGLGLGATFTLELPLAA
ncbi:MAG: ATP-binding protein [Steroidobacteraceae bacterium]